MLNSLTYLAIGSVATCRINQTFPSEIPCEELSSPPTALRGDAYGQTITYNPTENFVLVRKNFIGIFNLIQIVARMSLFVKMKFQNLILID